MSKIVTCKDFLSQKGQGLKAKTQKQSNYIP
jgi:hypothetical protein